MLPHILPPLDPQLSVKTIQELRPLEKNVNVKIIVLKKIEEKITKEGNLMTIFKVADETGASVLMLMDDIGRSTKPGDILLVLNGFVPLFDGQIRIACKFGAVIRTGHFTMQFKEIPDLSAIKWSADPDRPNHWNKEVIDLKRPRSRTKITLERARKDPRLQKQQRAPDQSALQ